MYLDISGMIMFQKNLRKEFARAFSKATLIVMLPLTMAAFPAAAQETAPEPAPAAEQSKFVAPPAQSISPAQAEAQKQETQEPAQDTVNAATSANDEVFLKEGETVSVLPQEESNIDTLEKRYPFLKEVLTDVRSYNEEFQDNPTKVMISTVRDTASKTDIVFVSVQGPMTCGASQCQMNIFVNNGEGYKQAAAGPAPLPIQVVKDKGEISLYFCSSESGRAQWVIKGNELQHVGIVTQPQSGPACPPPSEVPAGP